MSFQLSSCAGFIFIEWQYMGLGSNFCPVRILVKNNEPSLFHEKNIWQGDARKRRWHVPNGSYIDSAAESSFVCNSDCIHAEQLWKWMDLFSWEKPIEYAIRYLWSRHTMHLLIPCIIFCYVRSPDCIWYYSEKIVSKFIHQETSYTQDSSHELIRPPCPVSI